MLRRRPSRLGLFAALLALAAQVVAGALVPQPAWAASKASEAGAHMGKASHHDMGKAPGHDRRHKHNGPFCPFCLAVAHPAPTLTAPPSLPRPLSILVARATPLPPARAPPELPFPAAHPRGPPAPLA